VLGMPNHYYYECTRAKPITAQTVDTVAQALLQAKAEEERVIALAEATADALAPIAHYKKVDARAGRVVMQALPDVGFSTHRRREIYGKALQEVLVVRRGPHFTKLWTNLIGDACTVAHLMDRLRACEGHRQELARLERQFTELEEMLEAEERIRALVGEIEATRAQVAERLLGASPSYYHDAVRGYLPGLAGRS
jgi:hypothetical protein